MTTDVIDIFKIKYSTIVCLKQKPWKTIENGTFMKKICGGNSRTR